jgi:hypothetical protein
MRVPVLAIGSPVHHEEPCLAHLVLLHPSESVHLCLARKILEDIFRCVIPEAGSGCRRGTTNMEAFLAHDEATTYFKRIVLLRLELILLATSGGVLIWVVMG